MIRSAVLVLALAALSACAGHTPPPACRGDMFSLNGPSGVAAAPASALAAAQ